MTSSVLVRMPREVDFTYGRRDSWSFPGGPGVETAGAMGSIPGGGTKILHAPWCSQKKRRGLRQHLKNFPIMKHLKSPTWAAELSLRKSGHPLAGLVLKMKGWWIHWQIPQFALFWDSSGQKGGSQAQKLTHPTSIYWARTVYRHHATSWVSQITHSRRSSGKSGHFWLWGAHEPHRTSYPMAGQCFASSEIPKPPQYDSTPALVLFRLSVMSNSSWPHGLQHARPPCPSPSPGVCLNSCPLSHWCHPTISSSAVPFSSFPQSFPASGSFPMSQLFPSHGQSTGVSASTLVLPMNTRNWSPLGWTGWISLQSKGVSRIFSKITVQKHPPTSQTPTGTPTTYRYEESRQGTQETAGKQRVTDWWQPLSLLVFFKAKSLSHSTTYWKGPELRQSWQSSSKEPIPWSRGHPCSKDIVRALPLNHSFKKKGKEESGESRDENHRPGSRTGLGWWETLYPT